MRTSRVSLRMSSFFLIERSLTVAKRLEVLKSSFNSLNFEMKNRFHIEQNSLNNIYKFNQKTLNLERIKSNFIQQSRLIFDIITADKEIACYNGEETLCINPKASWLQLSGGDIVIHVHEVKPTPQATSYISCIPEWKDGQVSRLHNSHMVLDSAGFLVGESFRIRVQDLQVSNIVNKEMIDLSKFLIQENIFITTQTVGNKLC